MNSIPDIYAAYFPAFAARCFIELNPGRDYDMPWHVDVMAYELERIRTGQNRRLALCLPPRSLKTTVGTIAFTAFYLGHNPAAQIVLITYGDDLSREIMHQIQQCLRSGFYRAAFPQVHLRMVTNQEIKTTRNGSIYTTSTGGALTGRGADLIIIDDPAKALQSGSEAHRNRTIEWAQTTPFSRLNDPREGAIVIVAQRTHQADLVGFLTQEIDHNWHLLSIPAKEVEDRQYPVLTPDGYDMLERREGELLSPERLPQSQLDELRRNMGSAHFEAQYQQCPMLQHGNLVREEWLRYYNTDYRLTKPIDMIVCSWDTATGVNETSDYSVCTVWHKSDNEYLLLDVIRIRQEMPELLRTMDRIAREKRAHLVLIEDANHGTGCAQNLRRMGQYSVGRLRPVGTKEERLTRVLHIIEDGRMLSPADATWLDTFENELLGFPSCRHDDQVDSVTQFLLHAENNMRNLKGEWRSDGSVLFTGQGGTVRAYSI
jgi:predicted phage terminase large subunit-like protein